MSSVGGFGGPVGKVRLGWKVVQTLGWRWAATRAYLEAEHRSGVLARRTPPSRWEDHRLAGDPTPRSVTIYMDDAGRFLDGQPPTVHEGLRATLERLKERRFDVFGEICTVDSWHAESITPAAYPANQHWSHVAELPEADLKLVWEPSRFSWAYDLVRLAALDPEAPAEDLFWELFEDWCDANQPFQGVNWKCGQESAIRLMAVTFAVQAFGVDRLDADRRRLLGAFADVTARRIMAHWRYARSQDNNHVVSEAVGLITVGLLFPGLAVAGEALELGRRLLIEACNRLVFPDGGTSQYSLNYHRVFMENFIWAVWLYRAVGRQAPFPLVAALRRTHDFLLTITQKSDGAAGNWGNNDGALLLPLAATRFLDVRPTLLMAAQMLEGASYDWGGPAEEAVHWFWGTPERYLPNPPEPEGVQTHIFPYAGISIIINGRHRAMIRGGRYQLFRPPQCDFGHVELWVDGEQVVFDPGTWSYKPRPGEPDLSETQWHNGPHIPGQQQMTRLGRFLWGDWPDVEVRSCESSSVGISVTPVGGVQQIRQIHATDGAWSISDVRSRRRTTAMIGAGSSGRASWHLGERELAGADGPRSCAYRGRGGYHQSFAGEA